MITKTDCLLLLAQLNDSGIDSKRVAQDLLKTNNIEECIRFINQHRELDLSRFYTKLRKSYNAKKSKLYINIVKENTTDVNEVLTTLEALSLQIMLFEAEDKTLFLKSSRIEDIHKVILHYLNSYDLVPALELLQLIKADLKVFEGIKKKELEE